MANDWIELGKKQATSFINARDNLSHLKTIAVLQGPKKIFLICYCIFWRSKKIIKIEEMTVEEKQKTWEMAKEIADGRLKTIEEMKDLCRCLIALEYILSM